MAELAETKSETTQVETGGFEKYANRLTEQRTAQKAETEKIIPTAEAPATPEVVEGVVTEAPKDPSANGKPEEPAKEVVPEKIVTEPVKEQDWRKELGFDDEATPVVTEEKEPDYKQEISTYKEKLAKLEKLAEDPLVAAYKAAKEAGKDVSSFLSEVKGKDVNSMTPEQLWEDTLRKEGLSDEDVATEMQSFAELTKFEKIQKTKTVKQELINQQTEQLKKYADATSQDAQKQAEQAKQLAILADQQSKQFFNKIKDKEWQGMKMTPAEVNKLQNFLENDFKFQNADGSLNYELFAKVGNYALNERTILQNVAKKAETRGYEKAVLEYARANKNDTRFNSKPDVQTKNKSELAKEAAKSAFSPSTN